MLLYMSVRTVYLHLCWYYVVMFIVVFGHPTLNQHDVEEFRVKWYRVSPVQISHKERCNII
jgi:hypothetical protein